MTEMEYLLRQRITAQLKTDLSTGGSPGRSQNLGQGTTE